MRKSVMFIIVILFAGCLSCSGEKNGKVLPVENKKNMRVAVLGGSISEGYNPDFSYDKATYGWVNMINGEGGGEYPLPKPKNIKTIWNGAELYNFSIHGTTAQFWNSEVELRKITDISPDIVIVYAGANDFFESLKNDGLFSDDEFIKLKYNIDGIIEKLKNLLPPAKIIVVGYFDLFDGESLLIKNDSLKNFRGMSDAVIKINNQILKPDADKYACIYVSLYDDFIGHCYGTLLKDGIKKEPSYVAVKDGKYDIHPNTDGHAEIYKKIYEALEAVK